MNLRLSPAGWLFAMVAVLTAAVAIYTERPSFELCDRQFASVEELLDQVRSDPALTQTAEDSGYVTFSRIDERFRVAAPPFWQVTKPENPAHPAVRCRQTFATKLAPIMAVCHGPDAACNRMIAELLEQDEYEAAHVWDGLAFGIGPLISF
jgi:hypothetical protein